MKSIWTTSESQAILPSTQKTSDLQELIGDPNHDQEKLRPTLEPSETGTWFKDRTRAAKAEKNHPKRSSGKCLEKRATKPPQKTTSTLVSCPCHQQKKSDYFKELKERWRGSRLRCSGSGRRKGCDPEIRSVWTFEFQRYKQKTFSIFFKRSCQHLKLEQTIFRGEEHS